MAATPKSRIKRAMQDISETGQVSTVALEAVGAAVNLFVGDLMQSAQGQADLASCDKIDLTHLRAAVGHESKFDFLRSVDVPAPVQSHRASHPKKKRVVSAVASSEQEDAPNMKGNEARFDTGTYHIPDLDPPTENKATTSKEINAPGDLSSEDSDNYD
eukprot:CAMPEP_0184547518 /NCGR_PEP_ID=MMETSP0199_2-20130426/5617_1 /TAXON_ID=1112570 /ORGANISM="Thraustochytrium sp., Strain LLF1b" /LENGTH=158 /DNA_ID=CAMNT_0026942025 /DNA_START=1428 /DNA_END=1904 /DNA_ORIENTATION=+